MIQIDYTLKISPQKHQTNLQSKYICLKSCHNYLIHSFLLKILRCFKNFNCFDAEDFNTGTISERGPEYCSTNL